MQLAIRIRVVQVASADRRTTQSRIYIVIESGGVIRRKGGSRVEGRRMAVAQA
ncbi:hypothetical protein A2U01_0090657, partial [Trifolium medium]|nr:hypothetical protein [Trifolium medium]